MTRQVITNVRDDLAITITMDHENAHTWKEVLCECVQTIKGFGYIGKELEGLHERLMDGADLYDSEESS